MTEWVTGAQILVHSGAYPDPLNASAGDTEWAEACAAAVNAGIDYRLDGATWASPQATYERLAQERERLIAAGAAPATLEVPRAPRIEPVELPAEILWAARGAGIEAYKKREAVFGMTGYVDLQGAAIRVSRDYLDAIAPMLARYATVGIA